MNRLIVPSPTQEELRELRDRHNLSAQAAADILGTNLATVQRYDGSTSRKTLMPATMYTTLLLILGEHPTHEVHPHLRPCVQRSFDFSTSGE